MQNYYIFKTIVGSQAYGTAVATSDIDYKGIFVQHPHAILTFNYREQIEVSKDEVYFEVRRFLQLLQSANPTMLELLFMPDDCVQVAEPEFELIRKHRQVFLTKKCMQSFAGYAIAQIKKARGLDKKMNWEKNRVERKTPLHFCYFITGVASKPLLEVLNMDEIKNAGLSHIQNGVGLYGLFTDLERKFHFKGIINEDETSTSLRLSPIPKIWYETYQKQPQIVWYNQNGYEMHCKDFNEYQGWLENRNTQRYVDIAGHNQQIDGKNLMHCQRLLDVAKEIATEKTIRVRRPDAEKLRQIRRGEVDLNTLIEKAEADLQQLEAFFAQADLPDDVDANFINDLLLEVRLASNDRFFLV
jgi:uncharacterized protein